MFRYSPIAILSVLCLGAALTLALVFDSLRTLPSSIPLHGNSSLIISAACHPGPGQTSELQETKGQISRGSLKRGAVEEGEDHHTDMDVVGDCSFDSENVLEPVVGKAYM